MDVRFHDVAGATYSVNGSVWSAPDGSPFLLEPTIREVRQHCPALVSLGEASTPCLPVTLSGREYTCKLEYRQPSGSFKDRGAQMLVSVLKAAGVRRVVEDSSGNAGAALATYSAAAGLECTIVVPRSARGPVIRQIEVTGARLERVRGPRENATQRAHDLAATLCYASHIYNPLFFAGTARLADEILAQGDVPDSIILPVGNGTLLLGLYHGFVLSGSCPRLIAAQVKGLDPLVQSEQRGEARTAGATAAKTARTLARPAAAVAPGIAARQPARLAEMVQALRKSNGMAVSVEPNSILTMQRTLARKGLYVESTSAVAPAAAEELCESGALARDEKVMVILTGSGLKRF